MTSKPKVRGFAATARTDDKRSPRERAVRLRDELVSRRKRGYELYVQGTRERQAAEAAKGAAGARLREAEAELEKGGDDTALSAAEDAAEQAHKDYEQAMGRADRAMAACRRIDVQLEELYAKHFGDFAAEADTHSTEADRALEDMVAAYRRAQEAWARATVAWTPVCQALRVPGVDPFPLPDHIMAPVLNGWVSKPPRIELMDEWDEALDEAIDAMP